MTLQRGGGNCTRGRDAEPISVWLSAFPKKDDVCSNNVQLNHGPGRAKLAWLQMQLQVAIIQHNMCFTRSELSNRRWRLLCGERGNFAGVSGDAACVRVSTVYSWAVT